MSLFVDTVYKDFIKAFSSRLFLLLVLFTIIIFCIASYYAYTSYYTPKSEVDKIGKNVPNANRRTKSASLMFFYADWCPHCRNAKPIWEAAKSKYEGTLVNNYSIAFVDVNCSDDSDPKVQSLIKEYNIQGYPTIKLVYTKPDGKGTTVDFDAKITKNSLDQFINTVLNS